MTEPFSLPLIDMAGYTLYRLKGAVFLYTIGLAFLFCIIHAARRALGGPVFADSQNKNGPLHSSDEKAEELVYRYTVPQRLFHWANALSVLTLTITGLAIYSPGYFSFLNIRTVTWFSIHVYTVAFLLLLIIFHIVYDSFVLDRFSNMWFGKDERRRLGLILKNFFGLTREYPKYSKFNPGQILYHWAIALNLLALFLTGIVIWKPLRFLFPLRLLGLGWEFTFINRILHDLFTATLLALWIGHIYFGLFIKENWKEAASVLKGTVPLPEYEKYHESPEMGSG
ncbi:MAG: cytochrome b/b6 domain-containing protein [candidate division NC10 bacterium]|nr:cytochrome b/b6 domain-containing protein [candidate division NC10 bacterium]